MVQQPRLWARGGGGLGRAQAFHLIPTLPWATQITSAGIAIERHDAQ